jgi:hypothetical protein
MATLVTLQEFTPTTRPKSRGTALAPVRLALTRTAFLGEPFAVKVFVVEFQYPV